MSILQEFRDFINRGNMVDLAIGVVVGGAFAKIVTSFVSDIVSPPIGLLLNNINLKDLIWTLRPATQSKTPIVISYGNFLQAGIDFLLISLVIFAAIKLINRLHKKEEKRQAQTPPPDIKLLTEIRDLLKTKNN